MEAQADQQASVQVRSQDQTKFRPGISGNPSGRTKTQLRTEQFVAEFRDRHGREPTASEMAHIRGAGRLAAKIEANNTAVEHVVPLSNALWRTLRRLNLGEVRNPPPASFKTGAQLVAEMKRDGRLK
jgi:hypothetical protein